MRALAVLLLLASAACRSSQTPNARDAQHGAASSAAAVAPNRDPHGGKDVAKYIAILESDGRIADLAIDTVVAKLDLPDDSEIGDLGCGPGLFAIAFAQAAPRGVVFACDVEPRQLDALRARIAASGARNIVPVLASLADPHLPPARLDLVFIGDTYHHLRERVEYMRRLQDVLKPGGRLAILEYKPGRLPVGPPPEHKLERGVMERELAEAGWRRVERFDTHPYHDFEIWRVVRPWERR